MMKRRQFISLLGGTAAAWPLAGRAQPRTMPIVGFLHSASFSTAEHQMSGLRKGLAESGYVVGQNLAIEYRLADGRYDRLSALASDLVQERVAVLVAGGGNAPVQAAKEHATANIPIVFVTGSDPIRAGLVASLNRPGGNITGVSMLISALMGKCLDLVRQLVPGGALIGALVNPEYSDSDLQVRDLEEAARAIKLPIHVASARTEAGIDAAFAVFVEQRAAAVLIANDLFLISRRDEIVAQAARRGLPAIYTNRDSVAAGGLMSYAPSLAEAYRQAGIYAGRILKGEKAADLPVVQPNKFELVINLKTAKALGLDVPDRLLAIADEVIE
jgi:putative tryptophan/tyrosine transport system substrate-binding protein